MPTTARRSAPVPSGFRRRGVAGWSRAALVGCVLSALPLSAGQIRPVNLEEMTARADRIFAGRCLHVEVVPHPQLGHVSRVTFAVERATKGDLGPTLTIEVIEADPRRAVPALAALDVPRFSPGERVVLFLYPDGALGLTSPVALGQGKFSVLRDKDGNDLAVNASGNRDLLRGMSAPARARAGAALMRWDPKRGLPPDAPARAASSRRTRA